MAPTDQNSVDRAKESELDKKMRELKERAAARTTRTQTSAPSHGVDEKERQQRLAAQQRQQQQHRGRHL